MEWRLGNKEKTLLQVVASAMAIVLFAFLLMGDSIARSAWGKYGAADVALLLNRGDAALASELGRYYFNGGEYDLAKAKRSYEKAISIDPTVLWGHYQLARIYFVEGDFEKALEEINTELAVNPENLRSLYVRGLIYGYMNGELEKSEQDFRAFVNWASLEWAGYNDLAWVLLQEKKYPEAREVMQQAFDTVPQAEANVWLWNTRGVTELNVGAYASALTSFLEAEKLVNQLGVTEWSEAYPGNSLEQASEGYRIFKEAISLNIEESKQLLQESQKAK